MKLSFEKFHGAGNDFILIDNRLGTIHLSFTQTEWLCNRHTGIGADGLILIESHPELDFEMKYYNADGFPGSMCGNGGRCAVMFAVRHGLISQSAKFSAADGTHDSIINEDRLIKLSMNAVHGFQLNKEGDYIMDTGSPHLVRFVDNVQVVDVINEGRNIRFSELYKKAGINVNFVSLEGEKINMRTYERGVENETLSCGTGTVAVAIACSDQLQRSGKQEYAIHALGGDLKVYLNRINADHFEDIGLEGNALHVFEGTIDI